MDAAHAIKGERVVDVREISPRVRHTVIVQLFEHLDDLSALQLIADHDPRPLRLQLEAQHGNRCQWTYLEQGPDLWRVRLQHSHRQIKSCFTGACYGTERAKDRADRAFR
jgi:uncharacterized protein (DUF2249 family)